MGKSVISERMEGERVSVAAEGGLRGNAQQHQDLQAIKRHAI